MVVPGMYFMVIASNFTFEYMSCHFQDVDILMMLLQVGICMD